MERVFGIQKWITRIILIITLIVVLGMFRKILEDRIKKPHYQIISNTGEYHMTTSFLEKDGCVLFTDELGKENKICGSYSIEIFN